MIRLEKDRRDANKYGGPRDNSVRKHFNPNETGLSGLGSYSAASQAQGYGTGLFSKDRFSMTQDSVGLGSALQSVLGKSPRIPHATGSRQWQQTSVQ